MSLDSYRKNSLAAALPFGEYAHQDYPPPIIEGVPKLLYTDTEVAAMYGMSVSTVRNRYDVNGKWYDAHFPVPRSTDGSGKGRKAAVRWHWDDLCRYAAELPPATYGTRPIGKPTRPAERRDTSTNSDSPFEL
jgi:hypothetical protein